MSRKPNPPGLITYADCVRQNKALLREERLAAKELKNNPTINIQQIISDSGYACHFGQKLKPLPPEIDKLVREYLNRQASLLGARK
jgi:hypothetical protein